MNAQSPSQRLQALMREGESLAYISCSPQAIALQQLIAETAFSEHHARNVCVEEGLIRAATLAVCGHERPFRH